MLPLECEGKAVTKSRVAGRSSLNSIPTINLADIFNLKSEQKMKEEIAVEKSDNLCEALCNSYKFVVNYGVFEANYEWMPLEVSEMSSLTKWIEQKC